MSLETAPREPLTAQIVRRLLEGVLRRPADEGVRIVTLHWLFTLQRARGQWAHATLLDGREPGVMLDSGHRDAVAALHHARVALRRMRASCKEHRGLLSRSRVGRMLEATSRLQRATNAARDADVQVEWLDAETDGLPSESRLQALELRARLADGNADRSARVSKAFRRHLDAHVEKYVRRLSQVTRTERLGDDTPRPTFAEHLAQRVDESSEAIRLELHALFAVDQDGSDALAIALHQLRLRLKRQRALLAPHISVHGALGALYELYTRGQDLLGAMRDAAILAAKARYDGADALAISLDSVALGHQEAFLHGWGGDAPAITRAQLAAATALRTLGASAVSPVSGLPMEFERKYLLRAFPAEAASVEGTRIEQGWLPGTALRERLRRATAPDGTEQFTRTIKLGPAHARVEVEEDTDRLLFDALWPLTTSARISKRRHVVRHGRHKWEIDVFLDRDLVLAEVELSQEFETAEIPLWLAPHVVRDVTEEPAYFNAVMARAESMSSGVR